MIIFDLDFPPKMGEISQMSIQTKHPERVDISWITDNIIGVLECQDGVILYIYKKSKDADIKPETSERLAVIFEE